MDKLNRYTYDRTIKCDEIISCAKEFLNKKFKGLKSFDIVYDMETYKRFIKEYDNTIWKK